MFCGGSCLEDGLGDQLRLLLMNGVAAAVGRDVASLRHGARQARLAGSVQCARMLRGKPRVALMTITGTSGNGRAAARSCRSSGRLAAAPASSSGRPVRAFSFGACRSSQRARPGRMAAASSCAGSTRTSAVTSSGRRKARSCTKMPPQPCPASTQGRLVTLKINVASGGRVSW